MLQQFTGLILALLTVVKVNCCDSGSAIAHDIVASELAELTPAQRYGVDGLARSADVRDIISQHANQDPFSTNKRFGTLVCRSGQKAISYPIGVWDMAQMFKLWPGNGVPSEKLKGILMAAREVPMKEEECRWGGAIKIALDEADDLPLASEEVSTRAISHLLAGDIPPPHLALISPKILDTLCSRRSRHLLRLPTPLPFLSPLTSHRAPLE